MKQNVSFSTFADTFRSSDNYKNNFSYGWLKALFDYFEEYEKDTGEELEFDMVALCCEYEEYSDLAELKGDYTDIDSFDDLEEKTQVIYIWEHKNEEAAFIIQKY